MLSLQPRAQSLLGVIMACLSTVMELGLLLAIARSELQSMQNGQDRVACIGVLDSHDFMIKLT